MQLAQMKILLIDRGSRILEKASTHQD